MESSGATYEALKVGVALCYDGGSGQLKGLARMRHLALRDADEINGKKMCSPRFAASQAVRGAMSPTAPCNFEILEQVGGVGCRV